MASALSDGNFRDILASLFTAPRMIHGEPTEVDRYRSLYGKYVRLLNTKTAVQES
jgi:hypothetical protein